MVSIYIYKYIHTQCPIFAYEMVIYHMKYHHKLILTVKPFIFQLDSIAYISPLYENLRPYLEDRPT